MTLIAGSLRFLGTPKITLVPDYHRFSKTELFGFIFPTVAQGVEVTDVVCVSLSFSLACPLTQALAMPRYSRSLLTL